MNVIDPAAVAAVRALPGRRESLVCKVLRDSREKQALRVRRDREEKQAQGEIWARRSRPPGGARPHWPGDSAGIF